MDGVLSDRPAVDPPGAGRAGHPGFYLCLERLFLGLVPDYRRRSRTDYRGCRGAEGPMGDRLEPGFGRIDTRGIAFIGDVLCHAAAFRCRSDIWGDQRISADKADTK